MTCGYWYLGDLSTIPILDLINVFKMWKWYEILSQDKMGVAD